MPQFDEGDKRRYGYSHDKRSDCVQVVIALIVRPEGFPLAYEVLSGNTSDRTTLADFLKKIEDQYGKAERIWGMDRDIPTEKALEQTRAADPPVQYLGAHCGATSVNTNTSSRNCHGKPCGREHRSNCWRMVRSCMCWRKAKTA